MRKVVITQSITVSETETFEKYLKEIRNYPILNETEELMYAARAKNGDKKALELLINCNLRFVISVAKLYVDKTAKLEDLVNEGNFGLIEAAKRFDPTRGFKFITFGVWWIRNAIIYYKNNQAGLIKLPLHKISEMTKVKRRILNLNQELNREPSVIEIFTSFKGDYTMEQLNEVTQLLDVNEVSLDNMVDDVTPLIDVLESDEKPTDHLLTDSEDKEFISSLINILDDREKYIITRLYGLDGWGPLPLDTLGEEVGISREGVRQIRNKSLKKIRNKVIAMSDE